MSRVSVNGVELYYECHGAGEPLLLIAGLASDSQSWAPIVAELAREYLVILPDNRGVGRTTPQDAVTSIGQMADDCRALLDHLGVAAASVLGHSMGGFVAQECAIRYPGRVTKLILAATSAHSNARNTALFADWAAYRYSGMDLALWFRNIFYWIFTRRFFDNQEAVAAAVRFAVEYPYPQSAVAFEKQVAAVREFDCRKSLPGIEAQTLVICGREDLIFPPEDCLAVLQAIPGARVAFVENAAHSIHMENPAAFTECVRRFL